MNKNTSSLTNAANSLSGEQSQVFNQLLSMLGGQQGLASLFTDLGGPLAGIMQQSLGGAGQMTPEILQQFMTLASDPSKLAQFTGVDAPGLVKGATNYLSNPGATNLAQLTPGVISQLQGPTATGLAGPQAESFYRNEMQQGLNPQFAQNAMNQLQQQFGTGLNTLKAQAGPGQNMNAAQQAMTNQLLSSSANMGGQLAGESQQVAQQGAAGMMGAAGQVDQSQLQHLFAQLQAGGGLDAQKSQMLTDAAQLGTGYNQTALGNVGQSAGMGMNLLGQAQGLVGMGNQMNEFGMGTLQNLGNTLGNEAFNYTQLASQVQSQNNPLAILMQLAGMYFGMSGGGGFPSGAAGGSSGGYGSSWGYGTG